MARPEMGLILVTGATGYIGGRLIPELIGRGYHVRVLVRNMSADYKIRWPGVEIIRGDARNIRSLQVALEGVHTAFYLIHSMLAGKSDFDSIDIQVAENFRIIAEEKKLSRIIYLCGLGNTNSKLSKHLSSRLKVASVLSKGKVPVTVLKAAIIIGSGSASFRIIKHLSKYAPCVLVPLWAKTKCQPIAIRDVIKYMVGVLETDETAGKSYDIGGRDILTYEDMIKTMVFMMGKKKIYISIPFSSTFIIGNLASLFTSVPAPLTKCLIEGCKNDVICCENDIKKVLPFELLPFEEAVLRALNREEHDKIYRKWKNKFPLAEHLSIRLQELDKPPSFMSSYSIITRKDPTSLFQTLCRIGGSEGWFYRNTFWKLRGEVEKVISKKKTLNRNNHTFTQRVNDVIDFWRVEQFQLNERLLLRAEMTLPGKAWLEFIIKPKTETTHFSVLVYFYTNNLWGKLYWYIFIPFHIFIFKNLLRQIERNSRF